jgi:hypothetical protein
VDSESVAMRVGETGSVFVGLQEGFRRGWCDDEGSRRPWSVCSPSTWSSTVKCRLCWIGSEAEGGASEAERSDLEWALQRALAESLGQGRSGLCGKS